MKKIFFGLGLSLLGVFSQAQNGLENIIVEKYYVANAADALGSNGTLPVGSVTYRIYVDMKHGYKFQMAYGDAVHPLLLKTSTTFFNNGDRGATTPTYTKVQAASNTVMLDSWLSVGAACAGNFGVLKSEDNGVNNVVNADGILHNNLPSIGMPLTTQDGLLAGTTESVTFVGINAGTDLTMFDATSQAGSQFTTSDGAWASLNGSVGPTATNRVLIAQITTDGVFNYKLNIQIGDSIGGIQKYVASNPQAGEIYLSSLIDTLSPNKLPGITLTTDSATINMNHTCVLTAHANDTDGTISKVEFYINGSLDTTANYSSTPVTAHYHWTPSIPGTYSLTAKAIDNLGDFTISSPITFVVKDTSSAPYQVLSGTGPCSDNVFLIPVSRIKNPLVHCTGFDAVMTFDKNKVVPTGVINVHGSLIDSSFTSYTVDIKDTSINISIYLNSSAHTGTGFNDIGKVFSVEFMKIQNFNPIDTVRFTVPFMMESYALSTLNKAVKAGRFITYKDTIFTGKLKFWSNNSPIRYNAAAPHSHLKTNISGNILKTDSVQPDTLGIFSFNINHGDSISIEKNINDTTTVMPVINGYDAFLVQKVLVDYSGYTPTVYQMIAMDVNMDGVVSAGDLSQINQRTVKTIHKFNQVWNASNGKPSKDWLFVDLSLVQSDLSYRKSITYPANDGVGYSKLKVPHVPLINALPIVDYSTCPVIGGETYTGILLGDANGNFATVGSSSVNFKETKDKIIFDLFKAKRSGNYIDVPVSIISKDDVNALDFSIKLNNENLSFVSVVDNTNTLNMLSNITNDNSVLFTSSSLQNYDNTPITVRFNSISGKISSTDLSSTKAFINGELADVDVNATGIDESNDGIGINVYPNPASTLLNVEVSENSTIQLFDLNGKQVLMNSHINANQKQVLNVQDLEEGVYILKIINDKSSIVKRVVITK